MASVLSWVGTVVLIISIVMGVIGTYFPELFLKIPSGVILWAMFGNPVPPYILSDPYTMGEFPTWARKGDVIVAAAPKAGTTWMLYCSHQIRMKGRDYNFTDVNIETPWPDLVHRPGQTWKDIKSLLNTTVLPDGSRLKDHWDNPSHPFRIFKSHYHPYKRNGKPYQVLPVREFPNIKFIGIVRNGLDVLASFCTFFYNHRPDFRKMWGGFPMAFKSNEECMNFLLPDGPLDYIFFGYAKDWWEIRNLPNVLLLHYSDMSKDLVGGVKKMAKFLEVDLKPDELDRVVEKCSFKYMKAHSDQFNYVLWSNEPPLPSTAMCGTIHCPDNPEGTVVYKGKSGRGKATFSEELIAKWEAAEKAEFDDPALMDWVKNGGSFQ
mmetsp:Transcript_36368/g.113377  ORF Transcript_36368/g.113377 Transcript_36368/m.113377 type:complete len:377 (-) Transcript_36368:205-1335(-)